MLNLFRIHLPKKGDILKNPGRVLKEDKSKIKLVSKFFLNLLSWI